MMMLLHKLEVLVLHCIIIKAHLKRIVHSVTDLKSAYSMIVRIEVGKSSEFILTF